MPPEISTAPVIVRREEIERILIANKAESAIHQAAQEQGDMEHAQAMAMTGAILREIQKAETANRSDKVLTTAQHGPTSRLQSLIASGELGTLSLDPLPAGGLEAKFDTHDWAGWATVAWAKLKNRKPHPMKKPLHPGPQSFPASGRIGLLGDWGTGLYGAPEIAATIRKDKDPYSMLMHLGDVYYAGTEAEMRDRFLNVWPKRTDAVHRALNSNHDMYSGGNYYFENALKDFNQDASYFAHQNDHWTLVGLDVAYVDHSIDDEQVEWLKGILAQAGDRKIVLFSHHQLFSCYESQGTKLWGNAEFAKVLKSKRIFAWYWGHEHRCALYQKQDVASGLWGRCIGHGGMPQSRSKTIDLPKAAGFDKADWRETPAQFDSSGQQIVPPSILLEGENPHLGDERAKFTPHGYAVLTFDGKRLIEQIVEPNGNVIYDQELR